MNPNVSPGKCKQHSLLQELTNTAYNKQIEIAWSSIDKPNHQGRAALPHLIILAHEKSGPHSRLTAARWLCRNHYGLPAAIMALIELAFEPHEQLSFDALTELHRIDDPQAIKGVEGIAKWGPHKELRLRACQLLGRKTQAEENEVWETAQSIRQSIGEKVENDIVLEFEAAQAKIDEAEAHSRELEEALQEVSNLTLPLPAITADQNKELSSPPSSSPDRKAGAHPGATQKADNPPQIESTTGLLLQLLRHNDQQPLWLPSLLFILIIIAELLFLLPNTLLGGGVYMGVLFLLLYNLMYVEPPVRALKTLLIVLPLIRLLSFGATYYLATYMQIY